jgi:hypothetical protein
LAWTDPPRRRAAAACAALALAACASQPLEDETGSMPPVVLVAASAAGIVDLRAPYRAAACSRLAVPAECDQVVRRIAGEGPAPVTPPAAVAPDRYRIAFVPGFFSECFDRYARPFIDVERDLRATGFDVEYLTVSGRGTGAANAARLAARITALAEDPRPLIVVAYSKGLVDMLELAVRHPEAARHVAAIVSVAGAANGSPLAAQLHAVYRDWVAAFPLPGCEAGTGEEIHDLRRDVRLDWWRRNAAAMTLPVFALVGAPEPAQVSPGMRATWRQLAQVDPRNDGKLLAQDQVVPGGYLLGYVNADHWAIAIPVADELPALAFLFRDQVPRSALVRAAIDVVAATLAAAAAK